MIRPFACALIVMLVLSGVGCIRSSIRITSDPSGAEVTVNNVPRGRTPVDVPFIWYWYYEMEFEKPGYETGEMKQRYRAPVWAIFPLDLLAELFPYPIPDRRHAHFVMTPLEQ